MVAVFSVFVDKIGLLVSLYGSSTIVTWVFFFSGPPLNKAKLYKHQNRDQSELPNGARHSDYERIPS